MINRADYAPCACAAGRKDTNDAYFVCGGCQEYDDARHAAADEHAAIGAADDRAQLEDDDRYLGR